MKTNMAFKAIRNVVLTLGVILPIQYVRMFPVDVSEAAKEDPSSALSEIAIMDIKEETCNIECFLNEHNETLQFIAKTFKIDFNILYSKIVQESIEGTYDELNIGRLTNSDGSLKTFNSFEEGLIEYTLNLENKEKNLFNRNRDAYNGDAGYVIDLIKYFTNIYQNVDYTTAVAIGAAESGHYKVKYMLNCNNVFGGMSGGNLIKYRNIEYGILSYIRLLSVHYYGKGLNTVETIGRTYCPTYDASGNKIASPHWVNLVYSAKKQYSETYSVVTVDMLLTK